MHAHNLDEKKRERKIYLENLLCPTFITTVRKQRRGGGKSNHYIFTHSRPDLDLV